jgi:hypothetical protein
MSVNKGIVSNIKLPPRTYGKIVLTLENVLLDIKKLDEISPSQVDGLDKETETDLRILGCELIQTAGYLLKLPQVKDLNLFFLRENCHCEDAIFSTVLYRY